VTAVTKAAEAEEQGRSLEKELESSDITTIMAGAAVVLVGDPAASVGIAVGTFCAASETPGSCPAERRETRYHNPPQPRRELGRGRPC